MTGVVEPETNPVVAAGQREWLRRLETVAPPGRELLVQSHKTHPWVPVKAMPDDVVIWTRSVLRNEILVDVDSPSKRENEVIAGRLARAAERLGAVPLGPVDSGGRGWHVHVFFDGGSVAVDEEAWAACRRFDVDLWKLSREVLYDAVVTASGIPHEQRRYLDDGKVRWDAARKGSMVREFGAIGRLGYRKTMGRLWELRFPSEPPALWDVGGYADRISDAARRAVDRAREHAARPTARVAPAEGALARFLAHPCVRTALEVGVPQGERGVTGLHLAALARAEGLTEAEACEALVPYRELCARVAPLTDDPLLQVGRVYAWSGLQSVPCPHPRRPPICSSPIALSCPRRRVTLSLSPPTTRLEGLHTEASK